MKQSRAQIMQPSRIRAPLELHGGASYLMWGLASVLWALPARMALAEPDVHIVSEGRFFSDQMSSPSTVGEPCDREIDAWPTYWDDRTQVGADDRFYPQAQCQGTGGYFPYAPQVVSCGAQGYCLKFATGAGNGGTGWNRCEMAIANDVPFATWHYVEFKFKLPWTIPDTRGRCAPDDPDNTDICDPFLVQLFHQRKLEGQPIGDVVGGILLHNNTDTGARYWRFTVQGAKADAWGNLPEEPERSTLVARDVEPEQWVKMAIYFYMDPANTSRIVYNLDDSGWVDWGGQLGFYVPGETSNLTTDVKIGVYTPPLSGDLRMYLDDIIFDRYDDGMINYGE
jgi:hypothetical protein